MTAKRVLIADDEVEWRRTLRRLLEQLGCAVEEGSSYVTVCKLLDTQKYDLVVSDNGMPLGGESRPHPTCGLQLLAHAKRNTPNKDTLFIIHTASDDDDIPKLVEKLGGIFRSKVYYHEPLADFLKKQLS
jgi:CheY-like chemotaxis protein